MIGVKGLSRGTIDPGELRLTSLLLDQLMHRAEYNKELEESLGNNMREYRKYGACLSQ